MATEPRHPPRWTVEGDQPAGRPARSGRSRDDGPLGPALVAGVVLALVVALVLLFVL